MGRDLGGYALVDAFVVPADEYEVGFLGKLFCVGLCEWDSSGVSEDDCGFRGGSAGVYGCFYDRGHENHPGSAAVG